MLQIKNIHKQYETGTLIQKALDGVSLNLRDNEFVAILGPSGSGKTTLLNIIGGLDRYDDGDVIINGISTKKYKDRDWDSYRNHTIGFVFQSYNLIPHQTVLANVELALTISGISKAERKQRAMKALEEVGLGNQYHKKPSQMSGGQMQRVAIARALVNDPDILLADEPTGALDSETSVQVMDLLKEVAKDRLVVMVTHNPELAKEYATRIVELKDGLIINDSDPFVIEESINAPRHENLGKASMSLMTSLSLSFNNLRTKKARTFLTAFAGSIGIIGIALILSLSNGVNQYIQSIEEETLSEYPLQIQSTGFDVASMMGEVHSSEEKPQGDIEIYDMITNMFSKIGSNDLVSLKEYLESDQSNIQTFTNAIEYNYNVAPQIYSSDLNNIHQVHPDKSFKALGIGSSISSNSMMSSMMSTDVFYPMPSQPKLYEDQYDIKAGRWPENYNECVLVLTNNGGISDFMLYSLGLRDYNELETMIQQFVKEEKVEVPSNTIEYSYDDIIGIKFKLVNPSNYYQYDSNYDVYIDKSEDENYMKQLIEQGETLEIVGIVQPLDNANAAMLRSGINYPSALTDHIMKQAASSELVQKQLANPNIDIFTGKPFNEPSDNAFDVNSLLSIDENMIKSAFNFDASKINIPSMNIDVTQLNLDNITLPQFDLESLLGQLNFELSKEDIQSIAELLKQDFNQYLIDNNYNDVNQMPMYFVSYLKQESTQTLLKEVMSKWLQNSGLTKQFVEQIKIELEKQTQTFSNEIIQSVTQQLASNMSGQMDLMANQIQNAISVDTSKFAQAFKLNMNEEELSDLMLTLMMKETSTYDNNLKKLEYADVDEPSIISIYPLDFKSKQEVVKILDNYNTHMEVIDKDKVISYTDYVGTLMSSVTNIINVVSYVLVAFVAISLVVSSIMIGVITYISVLERKKEIGILRAIGASKRNISQVFNAETFIIGLFSGVLGIMITVLLLIPSNMIIHQVANNNNMNAVLPISGAIILIVLSVILTLIGGLIPSRKAAKEDPVTALRNE